MQPVKEASDLLLTVQVDFIADKSEIRIGKLFSDYDIYYYTLQGSVTVKCNVTLTLSECLTNEPMWTKTISMKPVMATFDSSWPPYKPSDLAALAVKYGQIDIEGQTSISQEIYNTQVFPRCPIGVFIEKDNKFHAELGHALEAEYRKILVQIYIYLDPREMAIVKNQAMELRKRKVY